SPNPGPFPGRVRRSSMGRFRIDYQVIIQFNPDNKKLGGDPYDEDISAGTRNLMLKALSRGLASPVVTIRSPTGQATEAEKLKLRIQFGSVGADFPDFRVYLRGHGDWAVQSIGGWYADHVAALLRDSGMPRPRVVDVTGCCLGRDQSSKSKDMP